MSSMPPRDDELTPRQRRVAARVAVGLTDKQIAVELGISKNGVRWLVHRIARRWDLDRALDIRVQIARIVMRQPPA